MDGRKLTKLERWWINHIPEWVNAVALGTGIGLVLFSCM